MLILIHLSTAPEPVTVRQMDGVIGSTDKRRIQEVCADLHRANIIRRKRIKTREKGITYSSHAYYY